MADHDDATGTPEPEDPQAGAAPKPVAGLTVLTTTEQLMGLGAALILIVADLIGDVFVDEYSIDRLSWLIAAAVVGTVWAQRLAGGQALVPIARP